MPPIKGKEKEVKERKILKNLTPNKLLTRLWILVAQIKARNNSYKLKNEIRQILYIFYQHNKSLKKCNRVIIIMEESMILITDPKTFCFNFDCPKCVDENLKHEIEFTIKSMEKYS